MKPTALAFVNSCAERFFVQDSKKCGDYENKKTTFLVRETSCCLCERPCGALCAGLSVS